MPVTPKRKAIEKRLGCPLQAYLRARFLKNATEREVARELGLDHTSIRYYIKKWDLPYSPKAWREKERKEAKIKSKPMPLTHKRKQLEERLGQPLRVYLTDRLLVNATQTEVAKEIGLDQTTIAYYIRKWNLPYDQKAARRRTRKKWDHLEVCVCVICKHRFCRESRESHRQGRCVMSCRNWQEI